MGLDASADFRAVSDCGGVRRAGGVFARSVCKPVVQVWRETYSKRTGADRRLATKVQQVVPNRYIHLYILPHLHMDLAIHHTLLEIPSTIGLLICKICF